MVRSLKMFLSIALVASFLLVQSSALAKSEDDNRPGWGYGDRNHTHLGPPGLSVNPVDNKENRFSIVNLIKASTNTGGNSISNRGGGMVIIVTGAANTVASVFNQISHSLFGA